jgi:hypothetical protein
VAAGLLLVVAAACGGAAKPRLSGVGATSSVAPTSSGSATPTTPSPLAPGPSSANASAASTAPPFANSTATTRMTVPGTAAASSLKTVQFQRARFQVPDSWPVFDLAAETTRCVRFDQHAVYLGHQGANATCSAGLLGRSEAVQIEPLDDETRSHLLPNGQARTINGLPVMLQPNSQTTHSFIAAFASLNVVMTVTWSSNQGLAQQLLDSVHGA